MLIAKMLDFVEKVWPIAWIYDRVCNQIKAIFVRKRVRGTF